MAKIAIVYYSSTGNVYDMAQAVEEGAEAAGAEVRLRKAPELAPDEAIATNQGWVEHREATQHVAEASLEDLEWADGFIFGSPTRYGNMSAQLKQFIDTTGGLWAEGKLADKVAAGFTSTATAHGGQESTLLTMYNIFMHWGCVLVAPGYTNPIQFQTGNPYGVSHVDANGERRPEGITLEAARYLGERVARFAEALKSVRETSQVAESHA